MPQNDNIIRKINLGSGEYDIESINSQIVDMQGLVINKTEQTVSEGTAHDAIITRLEKLDIKRPIVLYNLYREPEYEEDNIDYTTTSYQSIICKAGQDAQGNIIYKQRIRIYNYRNKEVRITGQNPFVGFKGSFNTVESITQNTVVDLESTDTFLAGSPEEVSASDCHIDYEYNAGTTEEPVWTQATMSKGYWAGYDYTANGTIAYVKGSASDTRGQIEIIAPIDADKVMYVWADLSENSTQQIKYQIKDTGSSNLVKINMGMFTFKHNVRNSTSGLGEVIAQKLATAPIDTGSQILIYNFRMLDEDNQPNNVCLLNVAQEEYEGDQLVSREFEGSVSFNQQLFSLRIKVVKNGTGWQISEYDARALESSQINFSGVNIKKDEISINSYTNTINDFLRAKKNIVLATSTDTIGIAPVGLYNFKLNNPDYSRSNYASLRHANGDYTDFIGAYTTFYDPQYKDCLYGSDIGSAYQIYMQRQKRVGIERRYFRYYNPDQPGGYEEKTWRWLREVGTWADLEDVIITKGSNTPHTFKYSSDFGPIRPPREQTEEFTSGIVSQNKTMLSTYAYAKIEFNIPFSTSAIKVYYYFNNGVDGNWAQISKLDTYLTDDNICHEEQGDQITGDEGFNFKLYNPSSISGKHFITVKYIKSSIPESGDDIFAIGGIFINDASKTSYVWTKGYKDIGVNSDVYSREVNETGAPKIGKITEIYRDPYDKTQSYIVFTPEGADSNKIKDREHLITKAVYIPDRSVHKITSTDSYDRAYVVTKTGSQTLTVISQGSTPNTLVQRGTSGIIWIGTPTSTITSPNFQAVNVGYANTHYPMNPTTSAAYDRAYVIGAGSTQTYYYYYRIEKEDKIAYSIAQRNSNGQLFVAAPTLEYHAVNKGYVDANFVPKLTTTAGSTRAFVQTSGGSISGITVTSNIEGNTSAIIVRDANNRAQINTPTVALDISNKGYVDDNLPRIIRG